MPIDIARIFQRAVLEDQRQCFDKAESGYLKTLKIQPRHIDARYNLALIYLRTGRWLQALSHLDQALTEDRHSADIFYSRGRALSKLGRSAEALSSLRQASQLSPADPRILVEIGNELTVQQRPSEALAAYQQAYRTVPAYADAAGATAQALIGLRRYDAAVNLLEECLPRFTDDYRILSLYGQALYCRGDAPRALDVLDRAMRLQPQHQPNRMFALYAARDCLQWQREQTLIDAYREALRQARREADKPVMALGLLYFAFGVDEFFQLAKARASRVKESVRVHASSPATLNCDQGKIHLGYLSPDYRQHPTLQLLIDVLAQHDRSRFCVTAYNIGPLDGSEWQHRAMRAVDRFVDLHEMDSKSAADRIRADKVDILVDLSVYTQFSRPEIPALRPAPLCMQWLGYPGTSGSDVYHYIIADEVVLPARHAAHFSEHILWMPDCYQPNRAWSALPTKPARSELGLPEDAFVFCNFNTPRKMDRTSFLAWCQILGAVDDAVLWLLDGAEHYRTALRHHARENSIDGDRLVFAPRLDLEAHLARQQCADLFIDHLVYGAHTTASEALRAGLPLLTVAGDTFASRVSASVLTAAGLPELICGNVDDYVTTAITLARDEARLRQLRGRLTIDLPRSPLFDPVRFCRSLECGYQHAVAKARRGVKKGHIRIRDLIDQVAA